MELFEKTLDSKKIFDGRVLHIVLDEVELPDGKRSKREVVNHPGGVCVAALDDDNNLSFVKQFRYPYKEVVLELPAGKLEKGSTPLENGIIHLYACRVKSQGEQKLDEGEFLNVEKISLNKAVEMVLNNMIPDSKTQIAVLKTAALLKSGKI